MPTENDNFHPGHLLTDNFAQLQAIHKRHFYIGDEDIWLGFLNERQRNFTIWRFAAKFKACRLPVYIVSNAFPSYDLVFDKKNSVRHLSSPLLQPSQAA